MIAEFAHLATRIALADATTPDGTGESVKSGPLGIVLIIALCIGCYFLFKSMSKHLRRVREDFPSDLPSDPLHPDPGRSKPASSAQPARVVRKNIRKNVKDARDTTPPRDIGDFAPERILDPHSDV